MIISILYISSYYPTSKERFRGHFIEKQAKILGDKLNENIIVIKPNFSRHIKTKCITKETLNKVDIFSINFPNFFSQLSLISTTNRAFDIYKNEIISILDKDKPILIISNDIYSSIKLGNLISNHNNCPHYNIIHGEDTSIIGKSFFLNKIIKKELYNCNQIFAVSNKTKNFIISKFKYMKTILVNGNGIPNEFIEKYKNFDFKKNDILTITSIGNINYNKGFDIVIKALKDIKVPFIYYIIGDGNYKKNLVQMSKKYGLSNNIKFIGNISNEKVFQYLEKSHFFIQPSRNEAFGIVYLEAMITSNICIGSKGQGCEDFIINGVNGFVVLSDKEIKDILLNYNYNSEEGNIISHNALETAKNYQWESNVNNLIEVIQTNHF